jgi:AraC family transcriptional regulator, transcriptional activator FtrA
VAKQTKFGHNPPMSKSYKHHKDLVAIVIYEGLCTFEFGVAIEVFALPRPEFEFPWYECIVVSSEKRKVLATGGVRVEAAHGLDALSKANTIIIPGWRDRREVPPEKLLCALRDASKRGARFLSICSGVFVLAAAGLLKGRKATTHWRHMPDLKLLYPDIEVAEDVLYVDAGNVITSSGSAAGIDACVHLVRRDHGSKTANAVARRLVMPPHREGGQAQYVTAPVQQQAGRNVTVSMDWARSHLAQSFDVAELARQANMSQRTFLRRFQESVGMTPVGWLQRERMYRARELLETTEMGLGHIATQCGYESLETFRVVFRRIVGVSPATYRKRFRLT